MAGFGLDGCNNWQYDVTNVVANQGHVKVGVSKFSLMTNDSAKIMTSVTRIEKAINTMDSLGRDVPLGY